MGVLDSLESGLSKVLPYALPAALGAGIGGPLGAVAGIAASEPDQEQQLDIQQKQLEIQGEKAAQQRAVQQQQSEEQLWQDPEFKQYAAQAMQVDPAHLPDFHGLPFSEVSKLIEDAQKARMAGLKGPIVKGDNGEFGVQAPGGFKSFGKGVIPANVAAAQASAAGAAQRQDVTQKGQNQRQQNTLAQQKASKAETDAQNIIKNGPAGYRATLPFYERMSKAQGKGYYDYLVNRLAATGIPQEQVKQKAAAEAGFVPSGQFTKDGHKPVYLDPATGKKYVL